MGRYICKVAGRADVMDLDDIKWQSEGQTVWVYGSEEGSPAGISLGLIHEVNISNSWFVLKIEIMVLWKHALKIQLNDVLYYKPTLIMEDLIYEPINSEQASTTVNNLELTLHKVKWNGLLSIMKLSFRFCVCLSEFYSSWSTNNLQHLSYYYV